MAIRVVKPWFLQSRHLTSSVMCASLYFQVMFAYETELGPVERPHSQLNFKYTVFLFAIILKLEFL